MKVSLLALLTVSALATDANFRGAPEVPSAPVRELSRILNFLKPSRDLAPVVDKGKSGAKAEHDDDTSTESEDTEVDAESGPLVKKERRKESKLIKDRDLAPRDVTFGAESVKRISAEPVHEDALESEDVDTKKKTTSGKKDKKVVKKEVVKKDRDLAPKDVKIQERKTRKEHGHHDDEESTESEDTSEDHDGAAGMKDNKKIEKRKTVVKDRDLAPKKETIKPEGAGAHGDEESTESEDTSEDHGGAAGMKDNKKIEKRKTVVKDRDLAPKKETIKPEGAGTFGDEESTESEDTSEDTEEAEMRGSQKPLVKDEKTTMAGSTMADERELPPWFGRGYGRYGGYRGYGRYGRYGGYRGYGRYGGYGRYRGYGRYGRRYGRRWW